LKPEDKIAIINKGAFQPKKNELSEGNYSQEHGHCFKTEYYL